MSVVQKLRDVLSDLKKIRELIIHDQHDDRQFRDKEIVAILDKLLQKWPEEILKHAEDFESGHYILLNENQRLEEQLNYTVDIVKRWTNQYNILARLQSVEDKEQRVSNGDQKVLNEMTKLQCDAQEKAQRLCNQHESVNISPSQLSLVGIIHGHLPIDAEQGEKGEAKDKFSGFFRNSIEPLLDAIEECGVSETESSAIACRFFQTTYNRCKEALIERMKNQLFQLFQRSEVVSDEEKKRMDYTTMAFSLLCHGANVYQLKMKEDQALSKTIKEDMEKYSILQQKPTIQQELDKLLTSAIETVQSLISCVPPMVVDCLPYPDVTSKAYPTLQGDPTNYVTTQPALFFSYEAGGDKINGKYELLPPESHCFSRNWSDKESEVQISKKESTTQTEWPQLGPQRDGRYTDENLSKTNKKEKKSFQLKPSVNHQTTKGTHTLEKQKPSESANNSSQHFTLPSHVKSTWTLNVL